MKNHISFIVKLIFSKKDIAKINCLNMMIVWESYTHNIITFIILDNS